MNHPTKELGVTSDISLLDRLRVDLVNETLVLEKESWCSDQDVLNCDFGKFFLLVNLLKNLLHEDERDAKY